MRIFVFPLIVWIMDTNVWHTKRPVLTFICKLQQFCNFSLLENVVAQDQHRHLTKTLLKTAVSWRCEATNVLLHNDDSSSLHALQKGRREKSSFTITCWWAPWTVFSAAHVFTRLLTVTQDEDDYRKWPKTINACSSLSIKSYINRCGRSKAQCKKGSIVSAT